MHALSFTHQWFAREKSLTTVQSAFPAMQGGFIQRPHSCQRLVPWKEQQMDEASCHQWQTVSQTHGRLTRSASSSLSVLHPSAQRQCDGGPANCPPPHGGDRMQWAAVELRRRACKAQGQNVHPPRGQRVCSILLSGSLILISFELLPKLTYI